MLGWPVSMSLRVCLKSYGKTQSTLLFTMLEAGVSEQPKSGAGASKLYACTDFSLLMTKCVCLLPAPALVAYLSETDYNILL